jgi:uncharacterized repeat protein (TIGR03803 family)
MTNPARRSISVSNGRLRRASFTATLICALTMMAVQSLQAQTYTTLHNFTRGDDGSNPETGLTMDQAGNLYGTTLTGGDTSGACAGSGGCGGVFRMIKNNGNWIFTPLYDFQGGNDGSGPQAAVTIGPDGAIYGTTLFGGGAGGCTLGAGCGTVFKLTPPPTICHSALCSWTETVLYRFSQAPGDPNLPWGGVTFDAAGNLYGMAFAGGTGNCTGGCGAIYKLTPSAGGWTFSVIYEFADASDGSGPMSTLLIDRAGDFYGTAAYGGQYGAGTAFELIRSAAGWTFNTLYSFQDHLDGGLPNSGLVMDSSGNLYGDNTNGGEYDGGVVFELSPSGGGWNFSVIASPNGGLDAPVSIDSAGNVYGTTQTGGVNQLGLVFELTRSGNNWIENDLYSFNQNDGILPFSSVVFDSRGTLYGTTWAGGTRGAGVVWQLTR